MLTSFIFGVLGVLIICVVVVVLGLAISWIKGDLPHDDVSEVLYNGMLGVMFILGVTGIAGFLVLFSDVIQGKFK